MRLLKQLISKSLELNEEFELNKSHIKSVYYFYHAYGLAMNIVGFTDVLLDRKMKIFERLVSRYLEGEFDSRSYNKLKGYMSQDVAIITQALELIDKRIEEIGGDIGDLDRSGELFVGILALDYPTGE